MDWYMLVLLDIDVTRNPIDPVDPIGSVGSIERNYSIVNYFVIHFRHELYSPYNSDIPRQADWEVVPFDRGGNSASNISSLRVNIDDSVLVGAEKSRILC